MEKPICNCKEGPFYTWHDKAMPLDENKIPGELKDYVGVIKINLPSDEEDFKESLGESINVLLLKKDRECVRSNLTGSIIKVIALNNSVGYLGLEYGSQITIHLRGDFSPTADYSELVERFGEPIVENIKHETRDDYDAFIARVSGQPFRMTTNQAMTTKLKEMNKTINEAMKGNVTDVKAQFKSKDSAEYMWINISSIDFEARSVTGRLQNQPRIVDLRIGDLVTVNFDSITEVIN